MGSSKYEPVIGLEIHVQLNTKSKIFCSCSTDVDQGDNQNTCPVCLGMPGALPVLNDEVVRKAALIGLALNCDINKTSFFERKNYFYPDLSKGYQISQYQVPLNGKGAVAFYVDDQKVKIGITRAHIEEDAGKSVHHSHETHLNFNRAGVPLVEIVSEPQISSPREAAEYARQIRSIVTYLDVNDGNLEEGSLRCDCNVSVRKSGDKKLGTRTELKNINSFRFIEKAIEYEIERQIDLLESGERVIQETRLYDSTKNKTFSMRSKEEAEDYRYFPDPDLLPIQLESDWLESLKSELPELPIARLERFTAQGLSLDEAKILTSTKALADFYESAAEENKNNKLSATWVINELMGRLNEQGLTLNDLKFGSSEFSNLIKLIDKGKILLTSLLTAKSSLLNN